MEFFPKHENTKQNTDGYLKASIECRNGDYFINDTLLENNRAIHGDEVFVKESKVVGIAKRNTDNIVGILHLNINQKYGFTKKGVPIIKFTPLSNKYPTFMVPSKSRERSALLCVISFNKWETTNKNPVGQIEHIIGPVGNIENEINALLYKNYMCPKGKSQQKKTQYLLSEADISEHSWINQIKPDVFEYKTISIDPAGCLDIDDAFHVKQLDDSTIEVGIHIADVASRLNLEQLQSKFKCFTSIYFDGGKQENMLNDDFTYKIASLGNGELKRAVSLVIKFKTDFTANTAQTSSFVFKSTIVKNLALSYSEADNYIKNKDSNL